MHVSLSKSNGKYDFLLDVNNNFVANDIYILSAGCLSPTCPTNNTQPIYK